MTKTRLYAMVGPFGRDDDEMEDLCARAEVYVEHLHEFARSEAERGGIPARFAVLAILAWSLDLAHEAGIQLVPVPPEDRGEPTTH